MNPGSGFFQTIQCLYRARAAPTQKNIKPEFLPVLINEAMARKPAPKSLRRARLREERLKKKNFFIASSNAAAVSATVAPVQPTRPTRPKQALSSRSMARRILSMNLWFDVDDQKEDTKSRKMLSCVQEDIDEDKDSELEVKPAHMDHLGLGIILSTKRSTPELLMSEIEGMNERNDKNAEKKVDPGKAESKDAKQDEVAASIGEVQVLSQ